MNELEVRKIVLGAYTTSRIENSGFPVFALLLPPSSTAEEREPSSSLGRAHDEKRVKALHYILKVRVYF